MKVTTPLNVLLVEDDHFHAGWITDMLERAFPSIRVDPIRTETEFYSRIDAIASKPPDVVIMDVMLRWTDPAPEMSTPSEKVQTEGYRRAGLRCAEMLAKRDATKHIPIILFTVLTQSDLESPPNSESLLYLSKELEPDELVNRILRIVGRE